MSTETLLTSADEGGYIIAWKYKYKFETGRLDGEMTYGEAVKKCAELYAEDPEKTFWPHRLEADSDSFGKFHKAH